MIAESTELLSSSKMSVSGFRLLYVYDGGDQCWERKHRSGLRASLAKVSAEVAPPTLTLSNWILPSNSLYLNPNSHC